MFIIILVTFLYGIFFWIMSNKKIINHPAWFYLAGFFLAYIQIFIDFFP